MATITKKAQAEAERAEAIETLRAMLPPGSTVYCNLKHVSSSGMMRVISFHVIEDGRIRQINSLIARAGIEPWHPKHDGLKVVGCGMDMGFAVVNTLSHYLYPDGFECIGAGSPSPYRRSCPANDHMNGDRDYSPHMHSTGAGAYAVRHEWI
jgi:hypothetical protein